MATMKALKSKPSVPWPLPVFSMMHVEKREGLGSEIMYSQLYNHFVQQAVEPYTNYTGSSSKGSTCEHRIIDPSRISTTTNYVVDP